MMGANELPFSSLTKDRPTHRWTNGVDTPFVRRRMMPVRYDVALEKAGQKNDATDAATIAEAALRPHLHYVAVKSAEHQPRAVALRTHQSLVGQRT